MKSCDFLSPCSSKWASVRDVTLFPRPAQNYYFKNKHNSIFHLFPTDTSLPLSLTSLLPLLSTLSHFFPASSSLLFPPSVSPLLSCEALYRGLKITALLPRGEKTHGAVRSLQHEISQPLQLSALSVNPFMKSISLLHRHAIVFLFLSSSPLYLSHFYLSLPHSLASTQENSKTL